MPKATKSSSWLEAPVPTSNDPIESSQEELSSSDLEHDPEVTLNSCRQPQFVSSMFMPYVEGPKIDWTVNDGLYHRFLK